MSEYVFTSNKFKGNIYFGYDDEGVIIKFLNEANLTTGQMVYLSKNFPFAQSDLLNIVGKTGRVEEIIDVSYEKFWTAYDKRVNKKRCELLWYKLSEADRQVCLSKINKYKNYCRMNNRLMKDPDTYIRNRSWEDEL